MLTDKEEPFVFETIEDFSILVGFSRSETSFLFLILYEDFTGENLGPRSTSIVHKTFLECLEFEIVNLIIIFRSIDRTEIIKVRANCSKYISLLDTSK